MKVILFMIVLISAPSFGAILPRSVSCRGGMTVSPRGTGLESDYESFSLKLVDGATSEYEFTGFYISFVPDTRTPRMRHDFEALTKCEFSILEPSAPTPNIVCTSATAKMTSLDSSGLKTYDVKDLALVTLDSRIFSLGGENTSNAGIVDFDFHTQSYKNKIGNETFTRKAHCIVATP